MLLAGRLDDLGVQNLANAGGYPTAAGYVQTVAHIHQFSCVGGRKRHPRSM
jgi:hypothetical protein